MKRHAWTDPAASGRRTVILLTALLLIAAPGCGVPSIDGPADSFGLDFSLPEGSPTDSAVIFIVDGVHAEIFREMLEAGELPAIKKYFVDRGLYAPRAVANTPSVTLANLTSIATGQFPGHHGVTGINWFDRNRLLWRNYNTIAQKNTLDGDYTAPTIYEQFPDRTTFSVFFQPNRGTTKFLENWLSAGPPFFFRWYRFVDRLTLSRLYKVMNVARQRREMPAITAAYLLAPDFHAYAEGVQSDHYRDAIRHTDRQIGRVLGDIERAGLLDKIVIALVSDHSLGEVTAHFLIDRFLERELDLDLAPRRLWENLPFEWRSKHYRKYPAVTYGSGDRYWAICLRKPIVRGEQLEYAAWPVRPSAADLSAYPVIPSNHRQRTPAWKSVDLLSRVTEQHAVDAVAYAVGTDQVRVRRKTGEVEFRQPGGRDAPITYHVITGDDPLGWAGKVDDEALVGKPLSSREWLAATCETDYPDLPAQILAYFRAPRAGDIAVFAAPNWDFRNSNRAGHGGIRPEDMHTPLLLAGPGVPKATVRAARTVDLVPTILTLLKRPLPPNLDGQSLVETPE
jgi:arylsulfatase A-like enzyme